MRPISISDIDGLSVGHFSDREARTGCTAILAPEGVAASGYFPGFAPAIHESGVLDPRNPCPAAHGLVFSGGSAFGLSAASGVARYLREKGSGLDTGALKVPIVPGASIYDYPRNLSEGRLPNEESGYEAARLAALGFERKASPNGSGELEEEASGPFGAGFSARAGKIGEPDLSSPSGVGSFGLSIGGVKLAALAVVNPMGSVVDPLDGRLVSGLRAKDGGLASREEIVRALRERWSDESGFFGQNTLLAAVATNAPLSKLAAHRLAVMASAGIARALYPSGTLYDGDAIFVLARGGGPMADLGWLGAIAADVVAKAIAAASLASDPKAEKKKP
jgi:L-aminopeptidase/D-esterase-like protein